MARGASVTKATNREIRPTRKSSGFFVLGQEKESWSPGKGGASPAPTRIRQFFVLGGRKFGSGASRSGQAGAQCIAPLQVVDSLVEGLFGGSGKDLNDENKSE